MPDVYQGTELWEDSLVDPDNRRPVDFTARRAALADGHPKLDVVTAALRLRRRRPASLLSGEYRPLIADGLRAAHLENTTLELPPGRWADLVGGGAASGRVPLAVLFNAAPVALLERAGD